MNFKKKLFIVQHGSKSYTFAVQLLESIPREKVRVRSKKRQSHGQSQVSQAGHVDRTSAGERAE